MTRKRPTAKPRKLMAQLSQHEQRARTMRGAERCDALWQIWTRARGGADTAKAYWAAGRDAALGLLNGPRRVEGCERLADVLGILEHLHFTTEAAHCLERCL